MAGCKITRKLQQAVDDVVEVHAVTGLLGQDLVHSRDCRDPATCLGERLSGLIGLHAAGLQAQEGPDGLQIVLHPVVDFAQRRFLAQERSFAAAQVGDVPHKDDRSPGGIGGDQRHRSQRHRRGRILDLRITGESTTGHQRESLIGRPRAMPQARRHARQLAALQRGRQTESSERRDRVRTGVCHATFDIKTDETIADTWWCAIGRGVELRRREATFGHHLQQHIGRLEVDGLQATADPRDRMTGHDGDDAFI